MITTSQLKGWFAGRIPDDWFEALEVRADRDEILVVGTVPTPGLTDDDPEAAESAAISRVSVFREDTRDQRIAVASAAEARFGRKVSWGVRIGDVEQVFTNASVPVMTRLRMDERRVLDTLIDANIARSRSEALAWCVKLVGSKQAEWIDGLREALETVEAVRAEGPTV